MIKRLKHITSYIYPLRIEQRIGNFSPYLEVNLVRGKYVLDTANVNYSYGALHWVFDQTFQQFNIRSGKIKSVLILGFGAGSVASLLTEKYRMTCEITGVEKDQVVIDLAYKYFALSRFKTLELLCKDAGKYVQTCDKKFDAIVIDIYIDEQVPKYFHTSEFLEQLNSLMKKHGVLFFNKVVSDLKQKEELEELTSNMKNIFGECLTYKLTKNGIVNHVVIHDRRNTDKNLSEKDQFSPSPTIVK